MASSLLGLTITPLLTSKVISGTVTDTELLGVMNLLREHGLSPIDTLITPHDPADPQFESPGGQG